MLDVVAGFDWDRGNRAKCRRHGVSIGEIEELFARRHTLRADVEHSLVEERFKAIGQTDAGRFGSPCASAMARPTSSQSVRAT
jgi:uncharacterized DUF497 family protein